MSTEAQSQYQQQQQQQPADGASRPDMPHRSSSTQHVAQDDAHTHAGADTYASKDDGADIKPASRQPTVARPSHRGVGHDESKPYKHDPEHEQQTHDGAVPEKITTSGPPQPDPERAEKERAERREAQKAAKDKGAGDQNYPEQIHAGKAGVGPHIADRDRATFTDKVSGFKEMVMGKVGHKPEEEQHGHDTMTGEIKRKDREQEEKDTQQKFQNEKKQQTASQPKEGESGDKPKEAAQHTDGESKPHEQKVGAADADVPAQAGAAPPSQPPAHEYAPPTQEPAK